MRSVFRTVGIALVFVVLLASCGDDDEGAPTLTFTGSECIYSGPDTFSSGEIVNFTVSNESSVEMLAFVLELVDVTLEDFVADVAKFPPAEAVADLGPPPEGMYSFRQVDPDTEADFGVGFTRGGDFGTACYPLDGNPALPGEPLTVEE